MRLTPTRSVKDEKVKNVNLSTAMLAPSSAHGGLYAPKKLPKIARSKWQELSSLSYEKLALHIISLFKFDVSEAFFKNDWMLWIIKACISFESLFEKCL